MAEEPHHKRERGDEETLSLHDAIWQEKLETVQQLLEEKAEVSGEVGGQLLCSAVSRQNPEILIALLKAKADPNQVDRLSDASSNILQKAIRYNKPHMVSALLTYKASFRLTNGHGENALDKAASYGHTEIVELLLAAKAETTTCGLRDAAVCGYTAIIKLLLENQADIHSQDKDQQTALSKAAIAGREEVVNLLLAAKASAQMPLHHMLRKLHPIKETIVLALIKAKASCRLKDGHGKSALDLVRQYKPDDEITQLIKKCYEREEHEAAGLAFLSGLHPRTGASSLLTSLSQRSSSLFDRQVLRIPLKLAASTSDPNPIPRNGK